MLILVIAGVWTVELVKAEIVVVGATLVILQASRISEHDSICSGEPGQELPLHCWFSHVLFLNR